MASIDPYQTPRMTLHLGSTLNASPNSTNVSAKSESLRNNERNNQSNWYLYNTKYRLVGATSRREAVHRIHVELRHLNILKETGNNHTTISLLAPWCWNNI